MHRHYSSKQRSELVALVASGRATVAEAAARLGITLSTAYRWARGAVAERSRGTEDRRARAGGRAVEARFVRLVPSSEVGPTITVRVEGAELEVRRGFDVELLRAVVAALRGGST
jgi:transposase-like protein